MTPLPQPLPPIPRGPISAAVLTALRGPAGGGLDGVPGPSGADPFGEDVQLALYACYELHYRSFAGVDPRWEWDPALLAVRAGLEAVFEAALRERIGDDGATADEVFAALLAEPSGDGESLSGHLLEHGDLGQFREYVVHRSVYHLKEADPHAWLIPRLTGRAKAGVVTVEFDEYGGGRAERMHSRLFAGLMAGLGLDPAYGRYVDRVPAAMLATVNLMSLFALHRGRRAMMAGHFAAAEVGTPVSAARLAKALDRLGARDPACALFFTEHVEADAVHEQLMRREVVGGLLREEPELERDVVFGVRAGALVEQRLAGHVLSAWREGRSSLLPAAGAVTDR